MDHRFYRRLRPIAIVVLFFFSFFSIDPWNYAVWAQTQSSGSVGTQGPALSKAKQKAKSSSEQVEGTLRSIKGKINQAITVEAFHQDLLFRIKTLKETTDQAKKNIETDRVTINGLKERDRVGPI